MPISPIILQRRHAELGRIRLGAKTTYSNGKEGPKKLGAFRFTSPSEQYIRDLAALYGGEARPWDNAGKREWEVYTETTSIPVIAVKGGLSQWMETWSGGGCAHRCTGEIGVDGTPCDPDEWIEVRKNGEPTKLFVHREAKPTTRLSVMLPELEAVGVFRLESHGWNAAAEIPAVAELAQYVGDLVPAVLHLVERRTVRDGKTSRFVVPVLDLQIGTARLKEIVAAKSGAPTELAAAPAQQRPAIGAAPAQPSPQGRDWLADIKAAPTRDDLTRIWQEALEQRPAIGRDAVEAACKARAAELKDRDDPPPAGNIAAQQPAQEPAQQPDQDVDAVWQQVIAAADGHTLTDLEHAFAAAHGGLVPGDASADELRAFIHLIKSGLAEWPNTEPVGEKVPF